MPVVGLGTSLVNENPVTCPDSLITRPNESGPPSVPMSFRTVFCHRKACHAVGYGRPRRHPKHHGSGSAFSAPPVAWPLLLRSFAKLLGPPKVPMSIVPRIDWKLP